MKRYPTLVLLLLLFLGTRSASAAEPATQAPLAEPDWVGKSVEELTAAWGEPTKVKRRRGGRRLLVYKVELIDGVMIAPGTSLLVAPSPQMDSTAGGGQPRNDALSYDASRGVYLTTPDSAGPRVVSKAKAKFVVDRNGVVVEARLPEVPR